MLCDHLEGWDREGGRERDARGKRYGDICICITDSLCYTAETNTVVKQLYSNKNVIKKKTKNPAAQDQHGWWDDSRSQVRSRVAVGSPGRGFPSPILRCVAG